MKLLQQLFGLSLFGRSRSKVSVDISNNSGGDSIGGGGPPTNETTGVEGVADCRSIVAADAVDRLPADCDRADIASSTEWWPRSPTNCWSQTANRICWGSPAARRSTSRRAVPAAADLRDSRRTADTKLPRSRSQIRTNPWLPPSSPPPDRHLLGLGRCRSPPTSGSGSASCPSTPADSPLESGRRCRRLVESASGGREDEEETTPVASEGYCSVSSLCTMSDGACTVSTTACSDDMQMSVDSLASLFPTMMSSSSASFNDDKTGGVINGAFCGESVVDSGIVVSTPSIVNFDGETQRKEDFDAVAAAAAAATSSTGSDRSSHCDTPTNQRKRTSSSASSALSEHLCAVQTALEHGSAKDHEFDADVFPFGTEVHQRSSAWPPAQKLGGHAPSRPPSLSPPPRGVEEISSSLAGSVERLRRGRIAVDGAFGRALAEDRRRQRELVRVRRRMVEAQRDVLLGTLRDLRRDLDDQCRRLQVAYDAILAARWPQLHADTAFVSRQLSSTCQSAA